ncbi:Sapep family Mn(2+)-dependent dipeptidase [Clostridium sp. AM58-1XD]|uniref:Sapep family Mn(2+)-dependent dipeptidase n=1 Tax=Clostridium sp. AM58-1XD TaxID=2292307 RepID=UPI000E4EE99B|nr:Sapep family Mn(2+)-dependent dipeptidase [Clostridium sp. AM58-1XD]RGY97459.1 M20/M25/M40 family metallo-hydrolase [Clostridium sp. AM58-1XD]
MPENLEDIILKKAGELKRPMIESIKALVQIDSTKTEKEPDAPFGQGVKKALLKALSISEELGFTTVNLDNYIGYAQYGEGDDYICAIGHVDVVPAGQGWKQPPFDGYEEDGVLYGRGVLDNKGPVMACLYGLAALKELGIQLNRPVRIIFGCDEESGFQDLTYYLKKEKPPVYGFTPDCKYPVVYSERGRAVIHVVGEKERLAPFFEFVNMYFIGAKNNGDRLGIDYFHPEYGTMEMRGYKLAEEEGRVVFEVVFSYPAGITAKEILKKISVPAEKHGLKTELVLNYDPVVFEKDSPMVRALQDSFEAVVSMDGTPVTTTGGTYAKAMPNIVPFGPSFPGQKGIGHNPNEWMSGDDLETNGKIYALALYKLAQL